MGTKQFRLADHIGQTLIMDITGRLDDHVTAMVAISRLVVVESDEEYADVRLDAEAFPARARLEGMTLIGAVGTSISQGQTHPQLMGPTHAQTEAALALSARQHRRNKHAA